MNSTYVITGAGRGIGLEFATQLLTARHTVVAGVRRPQVATNLQGLRQEHGDRLRILPLDVTEQKSVDAFRQELGAETTVDVLINNAGVLLDYETKLEAASIDEAIQSLMVNSIGPMRVTQALLPNLRRAKNPLVAHITSLMGSIADNKAGHAYGYRMSKAALNMFSKTLSRDYHELTSVVLHPGWVQTEMGGENATTTPEESVHGMLKVLSGLRKDDSGLFFNFKGQQLPW